MLKELVKRDLCQYYYVSDKINAVVDGKLQVATDAIVAWLDAVSEAKAAGVNVVPKPQ